MLTAKPKEAIKITLKDGTVKEGLSWQTTPYDIAATIRYQIIACCC